MKKLCLLFLSLSSLIFAQIPEDEIVVRLNTEQALLPIYCAKVSNEKSNLPSNYEQSIGDILNFDIDHNGMTKALPYASNRQAWVDAFRNGAAESMEKWKNMGAFYVVDARISQDELKTIILSVNSNE